MKKGVLFSLILVLIALIIFSILILQRETISFERKQLSLKQQLKDMDYAYNSIERSLHILADIATKRAIVSSLNHIVENGTFFGNNKTEENLKNLVWNGTLNGEEISFMKNNTLNKTIKNLEYFYTLEPRKYNVSIGIHPENISITLNDAFHILFNTTVEVNISKKGVASMSRKLKILERISICNFEDPFYLINITEGKGSRGIKKSKYISNFTELILSGSGDGWCYGEITNNITSSEPERKIFFNKTINSNVDNFCGVIFENNLTQINTTYLKVSSVSNLTSYIGSTLLLSGEKGKVWNISNFLKHVENSWYANSTEGPSFFDRFEGKNYCSYCNGKDFGLETFVDKNYLLWLGISVGKDYSNTGYLYSNRTFGTDIGLNVSSTGVSAFKYFKIDSNSFGHYFE